MSADRPIAPPVAGGPDDPGEPGQGADWVSCLVDGRTPGDGLARACRQWQQSAQDRHRWHSYHLIGDVLRSDDLAATPAHDEAFLQALRLRLADEPVPLAPPVVQVAAAPGGSPRRVRERRWLLPAVAAAGVAAVGLSALTLRPDLSGAPGWNEPMAAVRPGSEQALRRTASVPAGASSPTFVLDGQVIRDARLDAYFEAHRGAAGPVPSAVPGGALRSVEILVPQR